jgi:hypothetical protein
VSQVWSAFVDGLFWFDSFIYFFFSYTDDKGREAWLVFSKIAKSIVAVCS